MQMTITRSAVSSPLTAVLLLFFLTLAFPDNAHATKFRDCSSEAKANIKLAVRYLKSVKRNLRKDYEFGAKLPRKAKRVKRRIGRSLGKMKVICDRKLPCRGFKDGLSRGSLTKRVHICYNDIKKVKSSSRFYGYCLLVDILAHEFAHSVGMPRSHGHNHKKNNHLSDATYRFGWFAGVMCKEDGLDRPLTAHTKWVAPKKPHPSTGIVLFAKKDYRYRGFNVTGSNTNLNRQGRNNSTTSVHVLTGTWEACNRPKHQGWCRIFNKDEPNLKKVHFNNRISSVERVSHDYKKGLVVYKNKRYRGPYRHITSAVPNLKNLKINNDISSLRVLSGQWLVCKDTNFRKCTMVFGSLKKVGKIKMNNKISSIKPLVP